MSYNLADPGRWPGLRYFAPLALALHGSLPTREDNLFTHF